MKVLDAVATISPRGTKRLKGGHPWIFRSDIVDRPQAPAGILAVTSARGEPLGWALWSPQSEISLRQIERHPAREPTAQWWRSQLAACIARRATIATTSSAYRLVHGEGDSLPSLIVDRYDTVLVVQLLSAGLDAWRAEIVDALVSLTGCTGILARHDQATRTREGLSRDVELLYGEVPRTIEVHEHGVRYLAAPWDGQKTGAFLDQRENRVLIGAHARGQALDCFAYHGSFALHMAQRAEHVTALDVSAPALARVEGHAALNGLSNITPHLGDAFDVLREWAREGRTFDTIVVDPPAFAKSKAALDGAERGYKDINLQAMRLLAPGGMLFSASCSFHLSKSRFLELLQDAAADSGRRIVLRALTAQPLDHPEQLTIPETGYLKGALLEAID
ncbi:MAG: class I SAM-dependent rRNA methyltransferase [Gemmatimonadaceae bacterium]|nr:class I SAM-dependent rRNA methyltransferase [Gemmatimonadaceae bacterium]